MKRGNNLDWLTLRLAGAHFRTGPEADASGGGKEGVDGNTGGAKADADNASGGGDDSVTFTPEQQAKVDRIASERAARAKDAGKKEAKAEADKEREREKQTAEERAKSEKEEETKKREAAEKRAEEAEWRADLAEHVVDSRKAVRLLDPETHLNEDRSVNVEAFLKDNPFMRKEKGEPEKKKEKTGPGTGGTQGKDKPAEDSWAAAEAADRNRR